MRRLALWTVILVSFGVTADTARGADDGDLNILTYPIGLVTGAHPIETDLGAGGEAADLYLDGVPVCSLEGSTSGCTVDLGDAPHAVPFLAPTLFEEWFEFEGKPCHGALLNPPSASLPGPTRHRPGPHSWRGKRYTHRTAGRRQSPWR